MKWPRAEDATHYILMGMDADLDTVRKHAVQEIVDFPQDQAGLSAADAYALASLSVDFRVGEAVNNIKMVYGMVPKNYSRKTCEKKQIRYCAVRARTGSPSWTNLGTAGVSRYRWFSGL